MSERDAYQAGVPCWVDTLQADPRAAMAFYAGVFGWEAEAAGPRRVLRGPAAGPRRRRDRAEARGRRARAELAHPRLRRQRRRERRRGAPRGRLGARRAVRRPAGRPHGRARRPLRRRVLPLGAGHAPGRAARQRARRLGDEHAPHARPRAGGGVLRRAVRLDDRGLRPVHDVPPARLRRRGALPAGVARGDRRDGPGAATRRRTGARTSGCTTPTRRRRRRRSWAAAWSIAPSDSPGFRNAVLADPSGVTFAISQLVA